MIVIFDVWAGLCNQMMDINNGIAFCLNHNYKFTFRNAAFRDETNISCHYSVPFETLFDTSFLRNYEKLYVEYNTLHVTEDNTYNFNSVQAYFLFKDKDFFEILKNIKQPYLIFKQPFP